MFYFLLIVFTRLIAPSSLTFPPYTSLCVSPPFCYIPFALFQFFLFFNIGEIITIANIVFFSGAALHESGFFFVKGEVELSSRFMKSCSTYTSHKICTDLFLTFSAFFTQLTGRLSSQALTLSNSA